ncbi:MAG: ABC transporter permease, partial [Candidatus Bipolaricaulia bacterium]
MNNLCKLAWRNIWRNRRRSLITAAAVAFSVMVLVFTEALLVGSHEQMALQALDTYKVGQIQVHARGYQEDPTIFHSFVPSPRLLDSLRENRELVGFAPRVQGEGLAAVGQESKGVLIMGIDPDLERRITPIAEEIVAGNYLDQGDLEGALVGDRLLKNLGAEPGDSLALIAKTRLGSLGAARGRIRGVFHTGVPALDGGLVYLPIRSAQELFTFDDRVTMLVLKLRDPSPAKLNQVKRALLAEVGSAELEVLTWPEFMPGLVQLLRFDSATGYVFLL